MGVKHDSCGATSKLGLPQSECWKGREAGDRSVWKGPADTFFHCDTQENGFRWTCGLTQYGMYVLKVSHHGSTGMSSSLGLDPCLKDAPS